MKINLRPINRDDYEFLYDLLKERTPEQTISFTMPSWNTHMEYIENNPYQEWCIILHGEEKIGNIYLARDNIMGYFIKKEHIGKGYGTLAIKEMVRKYPRNYYIANINPHNERGVSLVRDKFKGEMINQISYRIKRENILNC